MNLKILVTGGLGYLGGRISKALCECGHTVFVGSRNINKPRPIWLTSGSIVHVDMEKDLDFMEVCSGIDIVVHLAAVNEIISFQDPELAWNVNTIGTLRLVQAAEKKGVRRFIYFSTGHVYGAPLAGNINEQKIPRPAHPYAATHRAAEDIVFSAHRRSIPSALSLRLSNAFGPPESAQVDRWTLIVNDLCRQYFSEGILRLRSSGEQLRDFIPLTEVTNAVIHLLSVPDKDLGDGVFNLGGSNTMSILEMAEAIADRADKLFGKRPPIDRPIVDRLRSSNDRQSETLVFEIDKLLSTGFKLRASFVKELDDMLYFCKSTFG